MKNFPLYTGQETQTWTWRDIKKALVGNTEADIKRTEAMYLLDEGDLRIQGPRGLEWHISGDRLMNNYLWGDQVSEKPWWRHYEETDAMLEKDNRNER